jgi:hypothetical protein
MAVILLALREKENEEDALGLTVFGLCPLPIILKQWYSNFFCLRSPICNFSSTLYPQSCSFIIH